MILAKKNINATLLFWAANPAVFLITITTSFIEGKRVTAWTLKKLQPSFRSNLEVLFFICGGRKTGEPGEDLGASREPTTNPTHMKRRVRESNPGHRGGRRALIHCATRTPHVKDND